MRKKQFEYGLQGAIIGLVIGAIVGFFTLNQIKLSQRGTMLPITIVAGAVFGAISGYSIGSKIGKNAYIEERLGFNSLDTGFYKDGRYWVGYTKWTDNRDNRQYILQTSRGYQKNLVSTLNGSSFTTHDCTSASKDTIPKYHGQARESLFKQLKNSFVETPEPEANYRRTTDGEKIAVGTTQLQTDANGKLSEEKEARNIDSIIGIFPSDNAYSQRDGRWTGVTKWVDKINNKECVMKTSVLINTNHTQNTQEYSYITTINGTIFHKGRLNAYTRDTVIEVHEFAKRLATQKMRQSYLKNNSTDFSDIFNV